MPRRCHSNDDDDEVAVQSPPEKRPRCPGGAASSLDATHCLEAAMEVRIAEARKALVLKLAMASEQGGDDASNDTQTLS